MIPKNIFQAWIGEVDPPKKIVNFMDILKAAHPDWNIILLGNKDVENFYSELPDNAKKIYDYHLKRKEWGLVLDPIRFLVPYKFGGIFMDTDMMMCTGKSFNELPLQKNLMLINSFRNYFRTHTCFVASSQGNKFMKYLVDNMGNQPYEIPRREVYNGSYLTTEYVVRFKPEIKERINCAIWKFALEEVYVPEDEAILDPQIMLNRNFGASICSHRPMSSHTINKHLYIKNENPS